MTSLTGSAVLASTFAEVDEPGADALLGTADDALIPAGSDVMTYGVGGSGKTTLLVDLACHLATARDWLEIPIARPLKVLIVENEGPRARFRHKLRGKLAAFGDCGDRLWIHEQPWAAVTFATPEGRATLAAELREHECDVLIAGPLVHLGWDKPGTLAEVAAFQAHIREVRELAGLPRLTVILVHHESKAGLVSGAWEGAVDTMLHVEARGNGYTSLRIQKARWDSKRHGTTIDLAWAAGDGFTLKGERDVLAEIELLLVGGDALTAQEIATRIGAAHATVRDTIAGVVDRFEVLTGEAAKALGRSPNSKLYKLPSLD